MQNMSVMITYLKCTRLGRKMGSFFEKEDGEVNVVAIVVLIAVAVVLALLFKDQVIGILNTLFGKIGPKAEEALLGPS